MHQIARIATLFALVGFLALGPMVDAHSIVGSKLTGAEDGAGPDRSNLSFEENLGQFDATIDFAARTRKYALALEHGSLRLQFDSLSEIGRTVRLELKSARSANAIGMRPHITRSNYLRGNNPEAWVRNVPHFAEVEYAGVYPGVDIRYYGNDDELEFDFDVAAGADPGAIALQISGADLVELDPNGDLIISCGEEEFLLRRPVAFQAVDNGPRDEVGVSYHLSGKEISFEVGLFDPTRRLIIDPILSYSSYLGGSRSDYATSVGTDAAGNIYVVGSTVSSDFLIQSPLQAEFSSPRSEWTATSRCTYCLDAIYGFVYRVLYARTFDLFISKFDASGRVLLSSTYMGGDASEYLPGATAHVSGAGEVFIVAQTYSTDLPLQNPFQSSPAGYWAARLASNGSEFIYASYFPSPSIRGTWLYANRLLVASDNLPVSAPINPVPGTGCLGGIDAGLWRINEQGAIDFATCIAGTSVDRGVAVTTDSTGDIYFAGRTSSTDFPLINPIQSQLSGTGQDGFLVRISADMSRIVFSSYFGGAKGYDGIESVAVAGNGTAYVAGSTSSTDVPIVNAVQPNLSFPTTNFDRGTDVRKCMSAYSCEADDLFVAAIDTDAARLVFSTYFGGHLGETTPAISAAPDNSLWVTAASYSQDLPLAMPLQSTLAGNCDIAVARFTPRGAIAFATYLGGTGRDCYRWFPSEPPRAPHMQLLDSKLAIVATTVSNDFPVTWNALQSARGGEQDGVLVVLDTVAGPDADLDGVPDPADVFPDDSSEWIDTDSDGSGDTADMDDDNDGIADVTDAFAKIASETIDSDADGVGDNSDSFPLSADDQFDTDNDSIPDSQELDPDNDGVEAGDWFAFDPNLTLDSDMDGLANETDPDDDGDGLPDALDVAQLDPEKPVVTFVSYYPLSVYSSPLPLPPGFINPGIAWNLTWTKGSDEAANKGEFAPRDSHVMTARRIRNDEASGLGYLAAYAIGVSFRAKSSGAPGDGLRFLVDGVERLVLDGEQDWATHEFELNPGKHNFQWWYVKDSAGVAGEDTAWIDDVHVDFGPDAIFSNSFE